MKTHQDLNRQLRSVFDLLATMDELGEPDFFDRLDLEQQMEATSRLASRFGAPLGDKGETIQSYMAYIGGLLAWANSKPATYFDSTQAADYLGITASSLYGLVERHKLTPLRGPRRSYRFTKKQLDTYLAQDS